MKTELTDTEEAKIQSKIASDPDAPEATDDQLKNAKPFGQLFPELAKSARRGRPPLKKTKQMISIRLDSDVLEFYRSRGSKWQASINKALRDSMKKA
jgi:uncharacterized protein (DUF4415 family)